MNNIRPISDLRNNYSELSKIVKESSEPLILTKNGYADMVLMSIEQFEEREYRNDVHKKILASEAQYQKTKKTYSINDVTTRMLNNIKEKENV